MQDIVIVPHTDIIRYDPDKALEFIAVAEAGEQLYRRAKDVIRLRQAIEAKLRAMAEYVCWRDRIPVRPHAGPGRGHKNRVAKLRRRLPENDPGKHEVHRWRKAVCSKGPTGTVIDEDKLALAVEDAVTKCCRIVEQQQSESHSLIPPNGDDRVMTPDDLALAIVEHFKGQIKGRVLEPCAGQGAFVRALQQAGHRPLELELDQGSDFFAFHEQVDWIITNPPWSKIREFIRHAYEVAHDQKAAPQAPPRNLERSARSSVTHRRRSGGGSV